VGPQLGIRQYHEKRHIGYIGCFVLEILQGLSYGFLLRSSSTSHKAKVGVALTFDEGVHARSLSALVMTRERRRERNIGSHSQAAEVA